VGTVRGEVGGPPYEVGHLAGMAEVGAVPGVGYLDQLPVGK